VDQVEDKRKEFQKSPLHQFTADQAREWLRQATTDVDDAVTKFIVDVVEPAVRKACQRGQHSVLVPYPNEFTRQILKELENRGFQYSVAEATDGSGHNLNIAWA
jgi:hypothetical protein